MTITTGKWFAAIVLVSALSWGAEPGKDWPVYGGGSSGQRYSPLTQINRSNVARLRVAWTWDAAEGRGDSQTQPIVIDGILYGVTPKHHVVALDGASGKLLWKFDSGVEGDGPNRGLTFWSDGKTKRMFAAVQSWVYALDPATGKPIPTFGVAGRIDLREELGRDPSKQSIVLTSPGIVFKDLLIVGGRNPEALPSPPGDIRAYDVRTGKLRWSFHTIPHPGELGYETWPKEAWTYSGSANNWTGMALDQERGIVYVPTGSAATDFYGADRVGDNLFANTLLALDAATGKRIWHYQAVKHDLWDRDFPSPPTLVTVDQNGNRIDALAQTTKHGSLFLFDRQTGAPLYPMESQSAPASSTPGEVAAKTQVLPAKPAPFARQLLSEDMLTTRTPEAHQWAVERFRTLHSAGQFVPFRVGQDTVIFPGFDGGAEWGGSAYDPSTGLLYVNANDLPWTSSLVENEAGKSGRQLYLRNCASCHGDDRTGAPPQLPSLVNIGQKRSEEEVAKIVREGSGRMPGFPSLLPADVSALVDYVITGRSKEIEVDGDVDPSAKYRFTGYHKFLDPDGYPAVVPPWGTLNAINVNTGEYAWKIPLGEYPELAAKGVKDTGTENYGGPIVTAGGLVFIAATNFDRKFRAFDKTTGNLLWETTLPMSGNATPVTYEVDGRQFVVVHATGGKGRPTDPSGGMYVAFALGEEEQK
ncbi:MAG: PQQ-binding-like beta-propeller repeat protein [Acidobacteria bacterium]|nr:PQQ-binding-like beta-propeller repeat protein [Acidobacteriota bacterium]